jgi:hypothetical protein
VLAHGHHFAGDEYCVRSQSLYSFTESSGSGGKNRRVLVHTQIFISTSARHPSHTGETSMRRQKVLAHRHELTAQAVQVPLKAAIAAQAQKVQKDSAPSGPGQPHLHLTP